MGSCQQSNYKLIWEMAVMFFYKLLTEVSVRVIEECTNHKMKLELSEWTTPCNLHWTQENTIRTLGTPPLPLIAWFPLLRQVFVRFILVAFAQFVYSHSILVCEYAIFILL